MLNLQPVDVYPFLLAGVALLSFGISWFLTPRLRDYAIRRGLFDMPEERRAHRVPTPRIGGLAMFAGFTLSVLMALLAGLLVPALWLPHDLWRISLLLAGSTIICLVMLVDDLRGLSPMVKLGWQVAAAALVILPQLWGSRTEPVGILIGGGAGFDFYELNLLYLAVPLTLFWIVGMMNTVNATDGLDGLAGGVVFIGAIILFLETVFQFFSPAARNAGSPFQLTSSLLSLALAAAILGFLIFNWHPASIFMGDCGAMFLGYALAIISIIDGAKLAMALLIIGFPVLDLAFVYLNRIYHKRRPTQFDRNHIHHRLMDMGWDTRRIVLLFYSISLVFGLWGVLPFPFIQEPLYKLLSLLALGLCLLPLLVYSIRGRRNSVQKYAAGASAEVAEENPTGLAADYDSRFPHR